MKSNQYVPKTALLNLIIISSILMGGSWANAQTVYDQEAEAVFYELMSNAYLQSIYDLEEVFVGSQHIYLPHPPPDAQVFRQFGVPFVVPADWDGFPSAFVDGLVGQMVGGIPVFDVRISENTKYGVIEFFNSEDQLIHALELPKDYNPYAFLYEKHPEWDEYSKARQEKLKAVYHPARVNVNLRLVASEDLDQYLYNQAQIANSASRVSLRASSRSGYFARSSGSTGLLEIVFMDPRTNAMELTISYPSEDQNEVIEVFHYDPAGSDEAITPITNIWSLIDTNVSLTGSTQVTWVDDTITGSVSNRYYVLGKTWVDEDLDELTDAREILVHKTDPEDADSDDDIMQDGWEVEHGFDPRDVGGELIAWWPLNETSGTNVYDASGNGHDGHILYSATNTDWADGIISNCLSFQEDGAAIVDFGMDSSLDPTGEEVTVSFWYRAATHESSNTQFLLGKPPWIDGFRVFTYYSNSPAFSLKVNGTNNVLWDATYQNRFSTERWTHFAGTYNGSSIKMYLDGVEVITTNATGPISTPFLMFRFGHGSAGQDVDGDLDDVRLYQNALTSNEVYRLAQGGADPDADGFSNIEEFEADTDPLTSNRYPEIEITYPVDGSVLP